MEHVGITPRVGDQARFFHILTVYLTQAVYCFIYILRRFMFDLVPLFIDMYVFKPEIRTQINDLCL